MTTVGIAISSLANGTIFSQVIVEARGALVNPVIPAENVSVTIYIHVPGVPATPESTQATVYEDEFLTIPLGQPLNTDSNGQIPGYLAPGQLLDVVATGGPLPSGQVLSLSTQASASTFSGDVSGAALANVVSTVLGGKTPVIATSFAGHPTSGLWTAGQSTIDSAGGPWSCTVTGTPGTWVQGVSSASVAAAQAAAIAASDAVGTAAAVVATEAGVRATADTTNATAISTEATSRSAADALLAPKASPALTGSPTAPTAAALDNSTKVATTGYADTAVGVESTARSGGDTTNAIAVTTEASTRSAADALLAPKASPALTGSPTAPTQAALDASTKIGTTAYTDSAVGAETSARTTAVSNEATTRGTADTTNATAVTTEAASRATADALLAPKASPALTGTPTAPTPTALDASTKVSTTAYADSAVGIETSRATTAEAGKATSAALTTETSRATTAEGLLAPLASPALTGAPSAPTQAAADATTKVATTAYADRAVGTETTARGTSEALLAPKASPALTGAPTAPTATALDNSTKLATTGYADTAVSTEVTARTTAVSTEATSRATADALLVPLTQKGAASGVGTLDSGGLQPIGQVPPSVGTAITQAAGAVQAGTQPAAGTGTFSYKYGNPLTVPKYLPDPTVDAFAYCKGDGTIDDYSNIMTAIGVASTLASRYGIVVPVNLGNGFFKVGTPVVMPSYTGFISHHGAQKRPGAIFQPWGGITDTAGTYLITTASNATGCLMKGVGIFINNAFMNLGGLHFNCSYGAIEKCNISNSALTAVLMDGSANEVHSNSFQGGALRLDPSANSAGTTVNGGSQTLGGPGTGVTITLTVTDGTKANPAGGYAIISGIVGVISYTGVSGNTLLNVSGGVGTPANGAGISFIIYAQSSLVAPQGLALHMPTGAQDNDIYHNEMAGDSIVAMTMRTAAGYGSACFTAHGGIDRLKDNLFETSDTALWFACPLSLGQQVSGNRFEIANGHGVQFSSLTGYSQWTGNKYSNNGLAENDRYSHLFVSGNGVQNLFTGEHFNYFSSAAFGPNKVAAFVYDLINTQANSNTYANCDGPPGAFVSAPFVYPTNLQITARSDVRAGFRRYNQFSSAPSSGIPGAGGCGTFGHGDTWLAQTSGTQPTPGGNERVVATDEGMLATTISGVTAFAAVQAANAVITVSDATKVSLGAMLQIPGMGAAGATLTRVRVLAKDNNLLTINAAVSTAVTSGSPVTIAPWAVQQSLAGVITLLGSATYSGLAAIAAGAQSSPGTISVSGSALANRADAAYTANLGGLLLRAEVTSAGVVTVYFSNPTAGSLTPPNGTVYVWVRA